MSVTQSFDNETCYCTAKLLELRARIQNTPNQNKKERNKTKKTTVHKTNKQFS